MQDDPKDWTPALPLGHDATEEQIFARELWLKAQVVGTPKPQQWLRVVREFANACVVQETIRWQARVSADRGARSQAEQELRQIDLAFGNVSALEGLTRAEKAAKCVKMLAALNAPAELSDSRAPRDGTPVAEELRPTLVLNNIGVWTLTLSDGSPWTAMRHHDEGELEWWYDSDGDENGCEAHTDENDLPWRVRAQERGENVELTPWDREAVDTVLRIFAKHPAPPVSQHEPSAQEKA